MPQTPDVERLAEIILDWAQRDQRHIPGGDRLRRDLYGFLSDLRRAAPPGEAEAVWCIGPGNSSAVCEVVDGVVLCKAQCGDQETALRLVSLLNQAVRATQGEVSVDMAAKVSRRVPFDKALGDKQELPEERLWVIVERPAEPEKGMPISRALGYLRFSAGCKDSPFFVIPGVGGEVSAWIDGGLVHGSWLNDLRRLDRAISGERAAKPRPAEERSMRIAARLLDAMGFDVAEDATPIIVEDTIQMACKVLRESQLAAKPRPAEELPEVYTYTDWLDNKSQHCKACDEATDHRHAWSECVSVLRKRQEESLYHAMTIDAEQVEPVLLSTMVGDLRVKIADLESKLAAKQQPPAERSRVEWLKLWVECCVKLGFEACVKVENHVPQYVEVNRFAGGAFNGVVSVHELETLEKHSAALAAQRGREEER